MLKYILPTLLLLPISEFAAAKNISPEASTWLSAVQRPSPAVQAELTKYPNLPPGYSRKAPGYFSSRVRGGVEMVFGGVLQSRECEPRMHVEFMKQVSPVSGTDSANTAIREFESDVIHIQVLACLEGVSSKQVAAAYRSAEFKLKGTDTVTRSKKTGDRVCQTTKVAILGESEYCYDEVTFEDKEATYIHSFNDWNREGVKAPVYFREMLAATTDVQIYGKPGTAFYTDIYVRGAKLPRLFKGIANSSILKSQKKSLDVLQQLALKQPAR